MSTIILHGFAGSTFLRTAQMICAEANIDNGKSQMLHDLFWRRIDEFEKVERGSVIPLSDCGKPD